MWGNGAQVRCHQGGLGSPFSPEYGQAEPVKGEDQTGGGHQETQRVGEGSYQTALAEEP